MSKADFDAIYTAADPRPYYRTLGRYDYQIPQHAGDVFSQLARAIAPHGQPRVADLCCSYGVNATTLNHDVDFDTVLARYRDPGLDDLDRDELVARDRDWFGARRVTDPVWICGIDSSSPAISYAVDAGLIDAGYAEDLESATPSAALATDLAAVDLITVSGGIGYITDATIGQVFEHTDTPRLAALCLRWIEFAPIADAAAGFGLVTERVDEATFPQRQFASEDERAHVSSELAGLGIDDGGREADGYHHTDLYVLRPEPEARAQPLGTLIDPQGAIDEYGNAIVASDDIDVSVFTDGAHLPNGSSGLSGR